MLRSNLETLLADQPLRGRIVELHTLTADDYEELAVTCLDPDVWRSTMAKIQTREQLRDYLGQGLKQLAEGKAVPLLIRLARDGAAAGSTRLAKTFDEDVLEIGWTFIAPALHRAGVNAEAKLLLLDYAFDVMRCRRVVFKVAAGNDRSKAALAKLGAVPLGAAQPSAHDQPVDWFHIDRDDWPERRRALEQRVDIVSAN